MDKTMSIKLHSLTHDKKHCLGENIKLWSDMYSESLFDSTHIINLSWLTLAFEGVFSAPEDISLGEGVTGPGLVSIPLRTNSISQTECRHKPEYKKTDNFQFHILSHIIYEQQYRCIKSSYKRVQYWTEGRNYIIYTGHQNYQICFVKVVLSSEFVHHLYTGLIFRSNCLK